MAKRVHSSKTPGTSNKRVHIDVEIEKLRKLYGVVKGSAQKALAVKRAIKAELMEDIGRAIGVRTATAEVYVLDGFTCGAPVDHQFLADELCVCRELFAAVKRELESPHATSLRTVKDNLSHLELTYNQIRYVIACLIRGFDLS